MPTARRSRGWSCLALLLASVVCGLLAGVILIGLPRPGSIADLGPADPSLQPLPRLALATYLVLRRDALDQPAGGSAEEVNFEVAAGESASSVVDRMHEERIVRETLLLRAYLRYLGADRTIQAGNYTLSGDMTLRKLAQELQLASQPPIVLTVPEGWRLEQIAESLSVAGLSISAEEFVDASRLGVFSPTLLAELPDPTHLEGFLFPDTYYFTQDSQPFECVAAMLETFERRVDADLRAGFAQQGLSLYQAVTLASIVEREAVMPDERPLIASVFLNRLAQELKLEADPTVQYALGRQPDGTWWKTGLTLEDLQFDAPHNTYVHTGLPPSPIANPGLESLRAVAFPETSTYLYFRAACDGSGRHLFADTLEQHLQNACP
jgi:peptidoglycan lytic transglycosylase G